MVVNERDRTTNVGFRMDARKLLVKSAGLSKTQMSGCTSCSTAATSASRFALRLKVAQPSARSAAVCSFSLAGLQGTLSLDLNIVLGQVSSSILCMLGTSCSFLV